MICNLFILISDLEITLRQWGSLGIYLNEIPDKKWRRLSVTDSHAFQARTSGRSGATQCFRCGGVSQVQLTQYFSCHLQNPTAWNLCILQLASLFPEPQISAAVNLVLKILFCFHLSLLPLMVSNQGAASAIIYYWLFWREQWCSALSSDSLMIATRVLPSPAVLLGDWMIRENASLETNDSGKSKMEFE